MAALSLAAKSSREPIYLDHAAATPLDPRVEAAMHAAAAVAFANPSSPHAAGRRARALLEDARERILTLVGGRTSGAIRDQLVFTSGATEANRLGVLGTAGRHAGIVASSARDHGSLVTAAARLVAAGWQGVPLPLDTRGGACIAAGGLAATSRGRVVVLCLTPLCGQTGIRDSLEPLAAISPATTLLVHADATQAIAWESISFRDLPLTSLAFAPCKFGGPRGIGALVLRGDVPLEPLADGPQERGLRGGTEPVALAVGFATALELAVAGRSEASRHVTLLRDAFERNVVAAAGRHGIDSYVVGQGADRGPHITTIAFRGCDRQAMVMAADLAGICLATGTACASGSSEPSAAVAALGLPSWVPAAAVRASFAASITSAEVDLAMVKLDGVFRGFVAGGLHRSIDTQ